MTFVALRVGAGRRILGDEMTRMDATDYRRLGRFVADTAGLPQGEVPFPRPFLAALRQLVPCDGVSYSALDRVHERGLDLLAEPDSDGPEPELTYWDIRSEHPLCRHHELTLDFSAYRLSDFISLRRLRHTRLYTAWLRPMDVEHWLSVGLDAPLTHTKVFNFLRSHGRDFAERDRAVLDALRPYLAARYALWEAARAAPLAPVAAMCDGLTIREREIIDLVSEGLTNGEIAQRLWISPGTVRRHLENIYAKLGVHTRTAAARAASHGS